VNSFALVVQASALIDQSLQATGWQFCSQAGANIHAITGFAIRWFLFAYVGVCVFMLLVIAQ